MNAKRRKDTISGNVKQIFLTDNYLLFGKYKRRDAGGRDYTVHVRLQGSGFRFVDTSDTTVNVQYTRSYHFVRKLHRYDNEQNSP